MKRILTIILIVSIFLNIFLMEYLGQYSLMIDNIPQFANNGFITGCNRSLENKYYINHAPYCNELSKEYKEDFIKYFESIK